MCRTKSEYNCTQSSGEMVSVPSKNARNRTSYPSILTHQIAVSLYIFNTVFNSVSSEILFLTTDSRQAVYLLRNNETCACNHCCDGIVMCITQPEWVFLALGFHHKMCVRRVLLSSVACHSVICFHTYLIHGAESFLRS